MDLCIFFISFHESMHIWRDKENASLDLKNIARKNKLQKFQNIWYMSKFMPLECTNLKGAKLLFEAMAKLWTLTPPKKKRKKRKEKKNNKSLHFNYLMPKFQFMWDKNEFDSTLQWMNGHVNLMFPKKTFYVRQQLPN